MLKLTIGELRNIHEQFLDDCLHPHPWQIFSVKMAAKLIVQSKSRWFVHWPKH